MSIVVLLLPQINPPKQDGRMYILEPGNLVVEIFCDDNYDIDVDLWVKAPKDKIVGYSTKSGKMFDLLRDDLGFTNDETGRNYEIALTRGVIPGEYIINVMLYNSKFNKGKLPIDVIVVVSLKKNRKQSLKKLLKTVVRLRIDKEEVTAFSFRLNNKLNIIKNSVSNIYKPLAIDSSDTEN